MTESPTFSGGWLDIVGILRGLKGWPLQADIEETFTPAEGGPVERRTGRVQVDRRRRFRSEIYQDGQPPALFVIDPERRLTVMGVVDRPETWGRLPTPLSLPPLPEIPAPEPPPLSIDRKVESPKGTYRYRLFNARFEDPDPALFAEP